MSKPRVRVITIIRGQRAFVQYCAIAEQFRSKLKGSTRYDPICDAFTVKASKATCVERITPTCWAVYELA